MGNVFTLNSGGTVSEDMPGPGSSWSTIFTGATSIYTDAAGNLFAWREGLRWKHDLLAAWFWTQISDGNL
jgi:hypothetical protein